MEDYGAFVVHPSQHSIVVMALANLCNAFLSTGPYRKKIPQPFDLAILIIFSGLNQLWTLITSDVLDKYERGKNNIVEKIIKKVECWRV